MAESLLAGAAVGTVFGELVKAVLEVKDKAVMFKHTLTYLQSTLLAIEPVIKEIEEHNNHLGRPNQELGRLIREMEEGTKVVSKCSKIQSWNYLAKFRHQEQLEALVDSLQRLFNIDMQALMARDLKETLLKVTKIHSALVSAGFGEQDSMAKQQAQNAVGTDSVEQDMEFNSQLPKQKETKKDDGGVLIIFKIDLHCEGCVEKVKRTVRRIEGVEQVKADLTAGRLTVLGKVDPTMLREKLLEKTKKHAEIISSEPKIMSSVKR